jgi:hypothetical protein
VAKQYWVLGQFECSRFLFGARFKVTQHPIFPVLRELARLVQDHGVARTCPTVRFPDDRSARDQERIVVKAGLAPRVAAWLLCLVEEQVPPRASSGP